MAVTRQRLRINAANSATDAGDTGPPLYGSIEQIRWVPVTGDTGGNLVLTLLPAAGDTAGGYVFLNANDCLGSAFTKCPMQSIHDLDGLDTGAHLRKPIVGAGDRIRAKTGAAGNATIVGDLYIWTYTG